MNEENEQNEPLKFDPKKHDERLVDHAAAQNKEQEEKEFHRITRQIGREYKAWRRVFEADARSHGDTEKMLSDINILKVKLSRMCQENEKAMNWLGATLMMIKDLEERMNQGRLTMHRECETTPESESEGSPRSRRKAAKARRRSIKSPPRGNIEPL